MIDIRLAPGSGLRLSVGRPQGRVDSPNRESRVFLRGFMDHQIIPLRNPSVVQTRGASTTLVSSRRRAVGPLQSSGEGYAAARRWVCSVHPSAHVHRQPKCKSPDVFN